MACYAPVPFRTPSEHAPLRRLNLTVTLNKYLRRAPAGGPSDQHRVYVQATEASLIPLLSFPSAHLPPRSEPREIQQRLACDDAPAGGPGDQHLRVVPLARHGEERPHENIFPPLVQRRRVRPDPVHPVGYGAQLLELEGRLGALHLLGQVHRAGGVCLVYFAAR